MKHYLAILCATCIVLMTETYALTVETIDIKNSYTPNKSRGSNFGNIQADADGYVNVINVVNEYLWFWLAAVAVWVLVYAGFMLMTAQWDKAKMKQANQALVWLVIGLAVAYFSYTVIRMVANWF